MLNSLKMNLLVLISVGFNAALTAQTVEIVPLYQMKVSKHGIAYKSASVEVQEGNIINNEIPQNTEFTIKFTDPWGFISDTAGYLHPEILYSVKNGFGESFGADTIDFGNSNQITSSMLKSLKLSLSLPSEVKANVFYTVRGQLKDKNSSRYTSFEYTFKLVKEGKKLPTNLLLNTASTSRGMASASYGIAFNFFEFKGEENNKFLYQTTNPKEFEFTLKGITGFKIMEGTISPNSDIVIYDKAGNIIEEIPDVLKTGQGMTIKSDKKELVYKIKPKTELSEGENYIVYLKLKDANNPRNILELSLTLYIKKK